MQDHSQLPTVGERYSAALEAHYSAKDLPAAMELYEEILVAAPRTPEAAYSRTQIGNIVRAVIPADQLFAAKAELVRSHFSASPPAAPRREELSTPPDSPARSTGLHEARSLDTSNRPVLSTSNHDG